MTNQPNRRDWWVVVGMTVSALSAAVSSFAGLRGLAIVSGWPGPLSALLPLTIDAYAMTATRVWLSPSTGSQRARRYARTNAVVAILASLAGNGVYHLIAAGLLPVTWVVVIIVGAVPAGVLGLLSHLAALRSYVDPVIEPAAVASTNQEDEPRTQVRSHDELLAAARAADAAYRAENNGKPITRDALRASLSVGVQKAGNLLRQLRAEARSEAV